MEGKKMFSTKKIAFIGILAAIVFVSNYLSFRIPVGIGSPTRIHLANSICLLSGFLLGGVGGGLAAGIGSFFYDLFIPDYAPTAYITLIFKFVLAFVCGVIAHSHKKGARDTVWNIVAGIAGSLSYIVLYIGRNFFNDLYFKDLPMETTLTNMYTRLFTSSVNAAIAVCVSIPLFYAIRVALEKNKLKLE